MLLACSGGCSNFFLDNSPLYIMFYIFEGDFVYGPVNPVILS